MNWPQWVFYVNMLLNSSAITPSSCLYRELWKPYKCIKGLSKTWAWGLHWFPKDTSEPFLPTIAIPVFIFSQDNGSLPCNYLFNINHFVTFCFLYLTFQSSSDYSFSLQDLPVQKQSDLVQDFYQSFAEHFNGKRGSVHPFLACLFWKQDFWVVVLVFRFSWGTGHSDNGAHREVDNDTVAQMGFLPWQLRWRAEGPGTPETNTVTFKSRSVVSNDNLQLTKNVWPWCLYLTAL